MALKQLASWLCHFTAYCEEGEGVQQHGTSRYQQEGERSTAHSLPTMVATSISEEVDVFLTEQAYALVTRRSRGGRGRKTIFGCVIS